ncbi:MAG: MBL fold metallo-hydrolase [Acidobacteria bacterium]|nr:MBL fold metallo-hydrolase [Acidobacteriota bacterium]MCB9377256.1 MBL fold metallo-hydrolase [Holophagales bacterium]
MLGSGTSTGVPVVGCGCAVCTSDDPRNRRLRPGVRIDLEGGTIVVDTSPDFREQALRHRIGRVDAVLYTHPHADHVFGLDDLRVFNFLQRSSIPCYGSETTIARLRQIFSYVFEEGQEGGGKPRIDLEVVAEPFEVLGERVVPVPVWHGTMPVFGYRIGPFALVTDVNRIPEESFARLEGLDLLILSALRHRPHPTHFTVAEAIEIAARIGAKRTVLTHIAHEVDHGALLRELPAGVEPGHDGLVVEVA